MPPIQPKSLRLNLKSDAAQPSRFDGGWWPRTSQPAAELPILVRALTVRLGMIKRIAYNFDTWPGMARHLVVDGHAVRLEGFPGQDPYSLRITSVVRGVFCLLVVPPDVSEQAGCAALAGACTQNGFSRDILSACGAIPAAGSSTYR
jgi:hypothetical protein